MKEKIDIFNDKYEFIGAADKKEVHKKGLWHRVFACILVNPKRKTILLQKKAFQKYVFERPDHIDISVGGHYLAGESIEEGVRELKEEVGIEVEFEDLISLGIRQTAETIAENYIANEFQHIFLCPVEQNLEDYRLEKDEVSSLIEIKVQDGIDLLLGRKKNIKGLKTNGRVEVMEIDISVKDFVPSYLKKDQFFLRLFIAAKRYIAGEDVNEIFC